MIGSTRTFDGKAQITTVIVVVPDELPTAVLADGQALQRDLKLNGAPTPRFWTQGLRPWHRRHMVDLRRQRGQSYTAGGPIKLLNLAGMRHAASLWAGARHHQWSQIVRGLPQATPWHVQLRRHEQDPKKVSLEWARAEFMAQPRVLAMATYNTAFGDAFDLDDVEAMQAGAHAYQAYRGMQAVCGDALITGEGEYLQPDSASMADWLTYLAAASRHLGSLDRDQRIIALKL
ncbi:hypothetical protein Lfu02_77190 [Longispora fulva]|uniref:Uncharacterized protein n=1 Tax=Longispora fulva TaxID=619741 RepID=A0A8J7GGB6_9ACTN|nr:hypothetical protein [Longispora fulva]MBG6136162.1 hypothetical protein [Longispora fulva]GIG63347.1 hypothetical protein Lfu02_77190 [Longispora fulva]